MDETEKKTLAMRDRSLRGSSRYSISDASAVLCLTRKSMQPLEYDNVIIIFLYTMHH